ncbi:MAG: S1 RNA-binding domain-containing protein, partial [Patescibacteria group bacterium]
ILKVNPFGLFVALDEDIHGLAHINQLNLAPTQKINEVYKEGEARDFVIISMEPKEHRLGLAVKADEGKEVKKKKSSKAEATADTEKSGEPDAEPKKAKRAPKAKAEKPAKDEKEKSEPTKADGEKDTAKKPRAKKEIKKAKD